MIKESLRILYIGSLISWITLFTYAFFVLPNDEVIKAILVTSMLIVVNGIVVTTIINVIKFLRNTKMEES